MEQNEKVATFDSSASAKAVSASTAGRILVVDDEESIRRTLGAILSDEGYAVQFAEDGASALRVVAEGAAASALPSALILDIWMPGMDGLEVLARIKALHPELPVIMVSGHATIATAVKATRLGAVDFIEKPLDLNSIVQAVKRVLSAAPAPSPVLPGKLEAAALQAGPGGFDLSRLNRLVFSRQTMRGQRYPQRTLANSALLYGQGLHSGKKSGLILEPLPADSGIHFASVSETAIVPAHVNFVESTGFATTVRLEQTQAGTIEHLMSALSAYGVTNVLIKCNGEVPVLDGSAKEFCALFDDVGVVDQAGDAYAIKVAAPVRIGNDKEFLLIEPSDDFTIDYTLRYPAPIGEQHFVFTLSDIESYKREISGARTFGFVRDVGMLQQQGLALGGRFDNFVLLGEEGVINTALRYPNEPVRHKILDAIGDLYLLGRRLQGRITAHMTGHSDNVKLAQRLAEMLKTAV
jgi:UDP-3-O-[3-hydroxymyristoyl] N-acetylglucosamine deacetylase